MIREFSCASGHVTERIFLSGEQDEQTLAIECACGLPADKVEFSRSSFMLLPGCGGFYAPHAREGTHGRPTISTGGGCNIPQVPGVTVPAK